MSKINVVTKLGKIIDGNLPAIFTGVAIGGVVLTGVAGYFAAKKTDKVIAEVRSSGCEEPTLTIIKKSWKYYIPVVASAGVTIGAVCGLNVEHKKAYAALLAAYTASQGDLKSLKDQVKEMVGIEKANEIEDKLMKRKLDDADKYIVGCNEVPASNDLHTKMRIRDGVTGLVLDNMTKFDILEAADMVNMYLAEEAADGLPEAVYSEFLDNLGYRYDRLPEMWKHIGWKIGGNNPCMRVKFKGALDEYGNTITEFVYDFDYIDVCNDDVAVGRRGIHRHSYNQMDDFDCDEDGACRFTHTLYD